MTTPAPGPGDHTDWPAIELATRWRRARVPFCVDGRAVGSVAVDHLDALRRWAPALQVSDDRVSLITAASQRDAALARINQGLREQGLIRAWRDETYPLVDPGDLRLLACIERAASRFWGSLTFGAHCNGWVADAQGGVGRLWVAQRAFDKATDPGAFDNLVGGGVPHRQTPFETLVREGWEEAGLSPAVMQRARAGRVLQLSRDIPEGLQLERIHVHDLQLQPDERPINQDGEVHAFTLHPVADALAIAGGRGMTADAALVTLDFALRRGLFDAATQAALAARAASLWALDPR